MDAWDTLVAGSTIETGDAWEHLVAQGGGSGGTVFYLCDLELEMENNCVDLVLETDSFVVEIDTEEYEVEVEDHKYTVEICDG